MLQLKCESNAICRPSYYYETSWGNKVALFGKRTFWLGTGGSASCGVPGTSGPHLCMQKACFPKSVAYLPARGYANRKGP